VIGHNGGPPFQEPINDLFVSYRWRKARREALRPPSRSIALFRLARARAAGVSYHDYVMELLDTGRHLQAGDGAWITARRFP
jgi:hypothetical protein